MGFYWLNEDSTTNLLYIFEHKNKQKFWIENKGLSNLFYSKLSKEHPISTYYFTSSSGIVILKWLLKYNIAL